MALVENLIRREDDIMELLHPGNKNNLPISLEAMLALRTEPNIMTFTHVEIKMCAKDDIRFLP